MNFVKGKFNKIIYQNETNGYVVSLFRVHESDLKELENTTIRVTGIILNLNFNLNFKLTGNYELNSKYNTEQFNVVEYSLVKLTSKEKIIEFLTSPIIKGCGIKTAEILYDTYKEKTLEKLKDLENILSIPSISQKRAQTIHESIVEFSGYETFINKAKDYGLNMEDINKIISKYKNRSLEILTNDVFKLKELLQFKTVDNIFLLNNQKEDPIRIYHLLLEIMNIISNNEGHTYYKLEDILLYLTKYFNLVLEDEALENILNKLKKEREIVVKNNYIYLFDSYYNEISIANNLKEISLNEVIRLNTFEKDIINLEKKYNIFYDLEQKNAIKSSLEENISIISGGPGTGKTTILKVIVNLYVEKNKLTEDQIQNDIALLAPTGRASKKMSEATGITATTIHRYLKWRKEEDIFEFNKDNKTNHKLIIVDEASMIDLKLFYSLLDALQNNIKLILVGDSFQLPSVGAGNVLNDLIKSEMFNYIHLTNIYRQSENSYIPYLAQNIKDKELNEFLLDKKDDYNFINIDSENFINYLKKIIKESIKKNLTESHMQILIPIYKGINGIDNINLVLRDLYNQKENSKTEISHNNIIYRENDKVLQLVNDTDNNIYNGDIGYITKIIDKEKVQINFDNNYVTIKKKQLSDIKHAYAISIHKSQGSEFDHVIIPILTEQSFMLYNKLIYTGVSRAKKTLILIGQPTIFQRAILNDYSKNRNTTLTNRVIDIFNA